MYFLVKNKYCLPRANLGLEPIFFCVLLTHLALAYHIILYNDNYSQAQPLAGMQAIHKDDGANACWICFKQTAEKGRNWTNKRETRAALSARWHLPSTITLTLAEAFTESTGSNDLLKVQAANALPGFLASPRQVKHSWKKSLLATQ